MIRRAGMIQTIVDITVNPFKRLKLHASDNLQPLKGVWLNY